jgi:CBS domain-containing protein
MGEFTFAGVGTRATSILGQGAVNLDLGSPTLVGRSSKRQLSDAVASRPDNGDEYEPTRRIPSRVPTYVDGLTSIRVVARSMVESGVHAVLVETPAGPVGLVTMRDVIAAVAAGADPDIVWAGDIMRLVPRTVSRAQHPADIGEEMVAYDLEIVTVLGENAPLGVASALDILGALVRVVREADAQR